MAQLVALMSGVVLGGVAEVVGSNLARDSLYPSVYIYGVGVADFISFFLNIP